MRQKLTASQWTILVLGAGLMISLIANVCLYYQQRHAPLPHLRGTIVPTPQWAWEPT